MTWPSQPGMETGPHRQAADGLKVQGRTFSRISFSAYFLSETGKRMVPCRAPLGFRRRSLFSVTGGAAAELPRGLDFLRPSRSLARPRYRNLPDHSGDQSRRTKTI